MKKTSLILLSMLLMNQPIKANDSNQLVIMNVGNDTTYILDYTNDLKDIEVLSLPMSTIVPLTCAEFKKVALNKVDFSSAPTCLMQSLNREFSLHITNYVDFKNQYTFDDLKDLSSSITLPKINSLLKDIKTNVNILSLGKLYQSYKKLDQLVYTQAHPILIKYNNEYIHLSGFLTTES